MTLQLPSILCTECREEVGVPDLDRRLLHGSLLEPLLVRTRDETFFAEWLNSFYARDVRELFGIRERTPFLNLLRLILRRNGGLVDYSTLSLECELSRPRVTSYLKAMKP